MRPMICIDCRNAVSRSVNASDSFAYTQMFVSKPYVDSLTDVFVFFAVCPERYAPGSLWLP